MTGTTAKSNAFMDGALTTNRLGQIALLKVELRALEKGIVVSKPTIECRCDLVLDDGERLHRAQLKYAGSTGWTGHGGVVPVGLRKWRNLGRRVLPFYRAHEIDLLLVYVRKIDQVLCFGPDIF